MARPILLFTGQWTDLPLEELATQAAEWGYQGLDLCCWGDHFEVQRALSEDDYAPQSWRCSTGWNWRARRQSHRVSQAVCDVIDGRHRDLVPDYVWGDGAPEGVRERAVQEMLDTARAAQKLGVSVLSGFTGSPIWSYDPRLSRAETRHVVEDALRDFARQWSPILDVCQECGLKYAFEVHPGQIAFDLYGAKRVLDALHGREDFGFTFDASHLHWQGVDPVEFLRQFPERIFHVHIKDLAMTLNGRTSLLGSYLPYGDPRRGWHPRSPGRGGIDWEAIIRALERDRLRRPLDSGVAGPRHGSRLRGGRSVQFVKRLDFEPPPRPAAATFR